MKQNFKKDASPNMAQGMQRNMEENTGEMQRNVEQNTGGMQQNMNQHMEKDGRFVVLRKKYVSINSRRFLIDSTPTINKGRLDIPFNQLRTT